jgi:copper(I)-binding protein
MKPTYKLFAALLVALSVSGQTDAQTAGANTIAVEHVWARATPAGAKAGAVYMTVVNKSAIPDRLLGATTPVADKVQFHSVSEANGVSSMRELPTMDIPPGAKVILKPGDTHVMLVGLKQPLKEGESIPLTLDFEKAGKVNVAASVAKVGAMQGGGMGSMTHGADMPMKK